MSKRAIESCLVASTAHISFATSKLLAAGIPGLISYQKGDVGWLIYAQEDMVMEQGVLPAELWELIVSARMHGCVWLMLDRDGTTYDDLPNFDWEEPKQETSQ